jgi:hypothetical protein
MKGASATLVGVVSFGTGCGRPGVNFSEILRAYFFVLKFFAHSITSNYSLCLYSFVERISDTKDAGKM